MKKAIFTLTMLFLAFTSFAQISQDMSNTGMQIYTKSKTPDKYTGSPYMEDDYQRGIIIDKNSGKSQPAFLRYNAVEDVVEIRIQKNDKSSVIPKLTHIRYDMGNYSYFIDNIKTEDENIEAYFAEFYDGDNVRFIGRPEAEVTPAQFAKTGYGKDKPANLEVEMQYYVSVDGGTFKEVRLKDKDFEDILGKSDKLEDYLDNHKIKSEKDVIEMLKFYDQNL